MAAIESFQIFGVDLPFRKSFKHSAAERSTSESLFLRCSTDSGAVGYGECLPRSYVTGESRDGTVALLRDEILPALLGRDFESLDQVESFLVDCDGQTPGWVGPERPQTAAWSAVDLALLDTFGRERREPVLPSTEGGLQVRARYSGVLSAEGGLRLWKTCLRMRLFGLRSVKLKVDRNPDFTAIATARRLLGAGALRVDANMAWSADEAAEAMLAISRYGIHSFEQPTAASDLGVLAELVRTTGLDVMADESLTDAASLQRLVEERACTAVNVRISKCGGLIAARKRCQEALAAGLKVQIGCQVGESSLLSAAQLALVEAIGDVTYLEGCFGRRLLRYDPASPVLQFGFGGRPPVRPTGAGFGVSIDDDLLRRFAAAPVAVVGRH